MKLLLGVAPKRNMPVPDMWLRRRCWRLVRSSRFELLILLTIVFNTVLMGLEGETLRSVPHAAHALELAYHVCSIIFATEAFAKIFAFTFRGYIADGWNAFDFFLVGLALGDQITLGISALVPGVQPTLLRVLRILRAARVLRTFRMITFSAGLRSLLQTVLLSLPALVSILGIYVIVLFTWAILAMELFSKVPPPLHSRYAAVTKPLHSRYTVDPRDGALLEGAPPLHSRLAPFHGFHLAVLAIPHC